MVSVRLYRKSKHCLGCTWTAWCLSVSVYNYRRVILHRSCYCFGGLHSKYAFCSKSDSVAYRHLNNVLISLLLIAGSDVILGYIAEALICPDARVLWQERWRRFKSGETSGIFLVQSQNLFALLLTTKFMKIVHLLNTDSRIFLKSLRDHFSQISLSLNF